MFCGTAAFAVPSLERLLAAGHTIARCITQPDRPRGRGLAREPSPVKAAALRLRVPLAQPERLSAAPLEGLGADVGVVAAYGQLIPRDVLALSPHGMLGVHPSLLPKYRGAAPVAWALLHGDTVTGVTIFRLNERLDAGDILLQRRMEVEPREDAQALTSRLAEAGAEALVEALEAVAEGRARATPQDEAQATLAPKLAKAQGRIDWRAPAETIERLVRATVPWPGASTAWRGVSLRVWRAAVGAGDSASAPPGTVAAAGQGIIRVAAGRGCVDLLEVQPAGRRRMGVAEFLAGHRMTVGERFET